MPPPLPLVRPAASFPVAVIMERRPTPNARWATHAWQATAVVAGQAVAAPQAECTPLHADADGEQFLWRGYSLDLYKDATESYWHNLMSRHPVLCVICQVGDDGRPVPVTVTADYDLASAGMEADDTVYSVPMPPEIYRWLEVFVTEHFQPAPRKARKRKQWAQEEHHEPPSPRLRYPRS